MRNRMLICVALFLAGGVTAWGQDPPPPGFSPAQDGSGQNTFDQNTGSGSGTFFDQYSAPPQDTMRQPYEGANQGGAAAGPQSSYPTYGIPAGPNYMAADPWPAPYFWVRAEALYWWTKASPIPVPLVTAGSAFDAIPGALGQPGTSVIMGNQDLTLPGRGGGRFTIGFTLDPEQITALEGTYFFVGTSSTSRSVFSDGGPNSSVLAIPFFDPTLPGESSTFLSRPGVFAGTALVSVDSFFQGAEANLLLNAQRSVGRRFDLLGGFRYLNLQESLSFQTNSPMVTGPADVFQTFDRFQTSNNFYGGQIGGRYTYENSSLYITATGKVAFGAMQEDVRISGVTVTNDFNGFGSSVAYQGGYFAQPTNIGTQTRTVFAVVPEANLNVGIRLSPWATFVVGYTFLYANSVARPGGQIDHVINPSQAPSITGIPSTLVGPARPALAVQNTDFWVQGINFAIELRY